MHARPHSSRGPGPDTIARVIIDALAEEIVAKLAARVPGARVRAIDGLTIEAHGRATAALRFSLKQLRVVIARGGAPEHAAREKKLLLDSVAEALEPSPAFVDELVPVLQPTSVARETLRLCMSRPFGTDLDVVYAFDRPGGPVFAVEAHRDQLGLSPDRLDQIALANLEARIGAADAFDDLAGFPSIYVRRAHPLEAERLLLTSHWPIVAEEIGGGLLAAAPGRGILLIAHESKVDRLADAVRETAARHPEPLGRGIVRFTGTGWRVNL